MASPQSGRRKESIDGYGSESHTDDDRGQCRDGEHGDRGGAPDADLIRGDRRRPLGDSATDAHIAVRRAIFDGLLSATPPQCALCRDIGEREPGGQWSIRWHHHSNRPEHHLDVTPLCRGCHGHVHAGHVPEPATGRYRTDGNAARRTRVRPLSAGEAAERAELTRRAAVLAASRVRRPADVPASDLPSGVSLREHGPHTRAVRGAQETR